MASIKAPGLLNIMGGWQGGIGPKALETLKNRSCLGVGMQPDEVSNPQNALIRECSFNPTDSSIVCAPRIAEG